MAPSLANTPASDSQQAARATPKGLAPPAVMSARKRADFLAVRSKNAIAARNKAIFLAVYKKKDALSLHSERTSCNSNLKLRITKR